VHRGCLTIATFLIAKVDIYKCVKLLAAADGNSVDSCHTRRPINVSLWFEKAHCGDRFIVIDSKNYPVW